MAYGNIFLLVFSLFFPVILSEKIVYTCPTEYIKFKNVHFTEDNTPTPTCPTMSTDSQTLPAAGKELKILTYNMFIRPPLIRSNGNDYKDERLELIQKEIGTYDILCLQELFHFMSSRRTNFVKQAMEQGFVAEANLASDLSFFTPRIIDGGVSIISKLNHLMIDQIIYSTANWKSADILAHKGVLYARVQIDSQRHLHIFSTHMQAGGENCANIRITQTTEMTAFIEKCTQNDGHPAVLTGDMNIDGKEGTSDGTDGEEYLNFMGILTQGGTYAWRDLLKEAAGGIHPNTGGSWWTLNRGMRPENSETDQSRLDYILLREGTVWNVRVVSCDLRPFETDESLPFAHLSDHCAVEAVLAYD